MLRWVLPETMKHLCNFLSEQIKSVKYLISWSLQKISDENRDGGVQKQQLVLYKFFRTTDTDIDLIFPCLCQIKFSTGSELKHKSSQMCSLASYYPHYEHLIANCRRGLGNNNKCHLFIRLQKKVLMLWLPLAYAVMFSVILILWQTKVLLIPNMVFKRTRVPQRADCSLCDS